LKKLFAILCVSMLLLAACGGNVEEPEDVTITIPAYMFENDEDRDAVIDEMKTDGIEDTETNEGGSLTIKVSASDHQEMMSEMEDSLLESYDEIVGSDDFQSLQEITHNDDYTELTITANQTVFNDSVDAFAVFGLGLTTFIYQIYDGTPVDEITVTIDLEDHETGDVFETIVFPDTIENPGD